MIDKPHEEHEFGEDSSSTSDSTHCSDYESDSDVSGKDDIHDNKVISQDTNVLHLPQVSHPLSRTLTASSSNLISKPQVHITSAIRQGLAVAQSDKKDKPCTREEFMHDTGKFQERIEEGREELKRQGEIQEQKRKQEKREKAHLQKRKSCNMKSLVATIYIMYC